MIHNRARHGRFRQPLFAILLAAAMSGVLPAPALANTPNDIWPALLRRDLARAGLVEWRLRAAAGASCPVQAADIGVVFDDSRAYPKRDRPLLKSRLGMGDYPVVIGVAPGSPADLGGLRTGDEVLAIGGAPSEAIIARRNAGALISEALLDEIGQSTAKVPMTFDLRRNGSLLRLTVLPVDHCAVRLVLFTDRQIEAHSDTRNVAISTGMLAFARTDDELALAAGHEFAHVINGDRRGAPVNVRRRMEDSADALGLHLMECAGYQRTAGITLFERLERRDWLGFLRAQTHRSWKARTDSLRALPSPPMCPVIRK